MADEQVQESETDATTETGTTGNGQNQDQGAKPKTLDEALAAIEKMGAALAEANSESAKRRKALKKYEDDDTKRKQADDDKRKAELSEVEKLKQEKAELASNLEKQAAEFKTQRIQNAVELAAVKMNFHDPADAVKLADLGNVDVEDGKVTGVDEALKKLAKAKPHLIKSETTTNTQIDATRRSTDKPVMTDAERQETAARLGVDPKYIPN